MESEHKVFVVVSVLVAALVAFGLFSANGCEQQRRECAEHVFKDCSEHGGTACALEADRTCREDRR